MPEVGYNFTDDFHKLRSSALLDTFAEFEPAVKRFSKQRKGERALAREAGEQDTSSSKVQELSMLLFEALPSGVDYKAKCTYLIKAGAHPRFVAANSKCSLLARAVKSRKPDLVRLLLDNKAPVDNFGLPGESPLCLAVGAKNAAIHMLKHFKAHDANFKVRNNVGMTPFELAVIEDSHEMVSFIAELGGAAKLGTVMSLVRNHCTARCQMFNCNPPMLVALGDLGAQVKVIKRYQPQNLIRGKVDGSVLMCGTGHRAYDLALRKRQDETRDVLMMGLFHNPKHPVGYGHVRVLDDEVNRKIYNLVFCDREHHPLIIKNGVLVERQCSTHFCGRQIKDTKFPSGVLSVPPTGLVYSHKFVEDEDARLPTKAELAEAARLEAEKLRLEAEEVARLDAEDAAEDARHEAQEAAYQAELEAARVKAKDDEARSLAEAVAAMDAAKAKAEAEALEPPVFGRAPK
jgi:hypothetical protein